jgi:hypothetical protein
MCASVRRRHVRHDLSHLHRLTCRQLLNAEDDLVIRCAGRVLEQFPKALQQLALVFRRSASPDKKRERRGRRRLSSREAASRSIILKDYVDPVFRNPGILRMQRRQFAGEFGLGLATQYAGLRHDSVKRHRIDSLMLVIVPTPRSDIYDAIF